MLSQAAFEHFNQQGYCVITQAQTPAFCKFVLDLAKEHLEQGQEPMEYEADVSYPGAPESKDAPGGTTVRRLLNAINRHPKLLEFATHPELKTTLQQLLGEDVYLSIAHHNCIMTKQPKYSSHTGWHRDSRYWNYPHARLVSVWLALTQERNDNGCLWVIPGSHNWTLTQDRFDEKLFLDKSNPDNHSLIAKAIPVELEIGDMLLFHSNLFHAAGNNSTPTTKYSLVLTYRDADNPPKVGTRSFTMGELKL